MTGRRHSNGFFEQLLDESLGRLTRELEKTIADGIGVMLGGATRGPVDRRSGGGFENVFGGGMGPINVIIHNNAPVGVQARQTTDAMGMKQLEIVIDQMVASALTRGRQTSGVLESLFNLLPGLSGR